jgi:CheY-like chemotaxis protein
MYVLQYSAASAAGTLSRLSTRIAGWAGVPPPPQQQQPQQTEQQRQQEQNHQQNMLQSRSSSAASAFLRSMGSRNGSLQGLHAAPGMFQRNSSNGTSLLLSGYSSMALADGLIYPCCGSGPSGLSLRHSLQRPSCSMARQLSMFTPASSGSAGVPQVAHSEVPEHHGQVLVLYVDKTQKDQATVTSLLGGQSGGEQQSSTSDASSSSELQQGSTWGSRGSSISATTNSSSSSSGGSRTSDVSTASGSSLAATNGVTGQSREFKVVCVGTGRAAIDWVFCAKHLPDIVLLDAALPDMSATEVRASHCC